MNLSFTKLIEADLAAIKLPNEPLDANSWERLANDAKVWANIGYPSEAAAQYLQLAAYAGSIHCPAQHRKDRGRMIREYALHRIEGLTRDNTSKSEQIAAEYALSLMGTAKRQRSIGLDDDEWLYCMCITIVGTIEAIRLCGDDLDETVVASLLYEYANSHEIGKQKLAALAYLRLANLAPNEELLARLSAKDLHVALKKAFVNCWKRELKFDSDAAKEGWHLFFPKVLARYNGRWSDLLKSLGIFMQSSDVSALASRRQELLRDLNRLKEFATPLEESILVELQEAIGGLFTEYLDERETARVGAHVRISKRLDMLISMVRNAPSNLGVELILPAIEHVRSLIQIDYESRLRQGSPNLTFQLAKPYYPLGKTSQPIEIQLLVSNIGSLEAIDVEINLQVRNDYSGKVSLTTSSLHRELIPISTKPASMPFYIRAHDECPDYYLLYTASWQGLSGRESRQGELRIVTQLDRDWKKPNPYSLLPIQDPERLKGRDQLLDAIYRGLIGGNSYYITGQKRVGKTSVAKAVRDQVATWEWVAVQMLWGEVAGADPASALYWLASKIESEANNISSMAQRPRCCPKRQEFEHSYAIAFATFRERFHRKYPQRNLLIVIDDFDELPDELYIGTAADAFFVVLRSIVMDPFVSVIFIGGEKLRRISALQGTRLNIVEPLVVDYLEDPQDFRELVVYPVEGLLEFSEDAISSIFAMSGGNPFYATFVCQDIYNRAVVNRTAYINQQDVETAYQHVADTAVAGQFDHFWRDGDHVGTEQESLVSDLNARLLLTLAAHAKSVESWVDMQEILDAAELKKYYSDRYSISRALARLEARGVVVRDDSRIRCKVLLLTHWLKGTGGSQLHDSLFDQELRQEREAERYGITDEDLCGVADKLVYVGERVNEIRIRRWLSQFIKPRDIFLAFKLLKRLQTEGYVSEAEMQHLAMNCFQRARRIVQEATPSVNVRWEQMGSPGRSVSRQQTSGRTVLQSGSVAAAAMGLETPASRPLNVFITTPDKPGESGPSIVRLLRDATRVARTNHGELASVISGMQTYLGSTLDNCLLLVADDLIASGDTALEGITKAVEELDQAIPGWEDRIRVFYVALVGIHTAVEEVNREMDPRVQLLIGKELNQRVVAFDPDAGIFDGASERRDAETLIWDIGARLTEEYPVGWNNSQLLVLLPDTCPDNTLPVFWRNVDTPEFRWEPLFERKT